ncbi:acyl-CoA dehydrogenase family protein [Amycolatopsis sp. cg5]|uniref:acyl-CoA dehydrogenase family protein n=1 Tax=Amycolatopsis sp. cg5 TaxID=3238802 RepID=UPI003525110F
MDLTWSETQVALHERFAVLGEELGDDLDARDREQRFSTSDWARCAAEGVFGLPVPVEYGGLGLDPVTCAYALEGLGRGCLDNGLLIAAGAHIWATQLPILRYGTAEQKRKYLPKLCSGTVIGAHAITEEGSGSDSLSLGTTATVENGHYVLNGRKRFITNAPVAGLFVIYATVNPKLGFTGVTAFLVDADQPGLTVETHYEKTGLRTVPWGELRLENCRIEESAVLGRPKQGGKVFATTMAWERALILAPLLGAMARQIDDCVAHAVTRKQFGQPIGRFQSVANTIVEMRVRLASARLLTYQAASDLLAGTPSDLPEIAQLQTSEAAVRTALDAMGVFGGYGYTTGAGLERHLRDMLGTRVSSGTSDVLRHVLAAKLGLHANGLAS